MAKEQTQSKGKKKMSEAERAARKEALKNEPKDVKFRRVIQPRVRRALRALKQISFCFGAGYKYTPDEAKSVVEALFKAVGRVEDASKKKQDGEEAFKL